MFSFICLNPRCERGGGSQERIGVQTGGAEWTGVSRPVRGQRHCHRSAALRAGKPHVSTY